MNKVKWEDAQNIIKNPNNRDNIYFVLFTLENDSSCRLMQPVIDVVENYFANRNYIIFLEIDAKETGLYLVPNNKFDLLQVPTFCIMKDNKINYIGHYFYPKEILIDWITEVMD